MKTDSLRIVKLGLPALLILALAACAGMPPPTEQVAVSNAAVTHAAAAGATETAPAEMRTARDKMARAGQAMAAKDHELALSLAQEAQVDAQLAEAKARSAKARKAADELQEDSRILREEIERKSK